MHDRDELSTGTGRESSPQVEYRIVCPNGRVWNDAPMSDNGELHRSIVRWRNVSDHCCGPRNDNVVTTEHVLQRRTVTYTDWEDQP